MDPGSSSGGKLREKKSELSKSCLSQPLECPWRTQLLRAEKDQPIPAVGFVQGKRCPASSQGKKLWAFTCWKCLGRVREAKGSGVCGVEEAFSSGKLPKASQKTRALGSERCCKWTLDVLPSCTKSSGDQVENDVFSGEIIQWGWE